MDIVIASNNLHKIEEYREIFQGWEGKILSMKDAGIFVSPEENGATFQENSLIKARACAERTDKVVLADDSGLIIPSLPDILGVETSRFLGENTPYPVKWAEILRRLEGKNREARFVCCITVVNLSENRRFSSENVREASVNARRGIPGSAMIRSSFRKDTIGVLPASAKI